MPTSRSPRPSWTVLPPLDAFADEPPATVLDHLARRFPRVGRQTWRQRLCRGLVRTQDGTPLDVDAPYRPHLRVAYFREVVDEPSIPFEEAVVHVDEHLVVADKPPFLPVVPGGPFVEECLLYRLERRLGIEDLAPVHRLDRLTSGLVVFARRREERGVYGELFARRRVRKVYDALVHMPEPPAERRLVVESRLERGEPFFRMRGVPGPPDAVTRVEVVDWHEHPEHGRVGRVRLVPESGKKHQLRVHLAGLGWPIVGDRLYPVLQPEAPDDYTHPLRLVATGLAFTDPVTGEGRRFESRIDL